MAVNPVVQVQTGQTRSWRTKQQGGSESTSKNELHTNVGQFFKFCEHDRYLHGSMLDVSFPLRVLAFASFVLGLVGSLLSMAAVLWFGIVYSSSTEYGYFWFVVLILYLIPSAFGMLATQLSMYLYPTLLTYSGMEVAFNTTKSCWWCCVCCFPYHDTVTRAFTNLAMITAAIGLVQVSWQVQPQCLRLLYIVVFVHVQDFWWDCWNGASTDVTFLLLFGFYLSFLLYNCNISTATKEHGKLLDNGFSPPRIVPKKASTSTQNMFLWWTMVVLSNFPEKSDNLSCLTD